MNPILRHPWWRHQMETFSVLLAICAGNSPVPGEFPAQRPVTRSFDVFFDLHPNKRLSKQWWGWWFETPSWSLWRHRNAILYFSFPKPAVPDFTHTNELLPASISIAIVGYANSMSLAKLFGKKHGYEVDATQVNFTAVQSHYRQFIISIDNVIFIAIAIAIVTIKKNNSKIIRCLRHLHTHH